MTEGSGAAGETGGGEAPELDFRILGPLEVAAGGYRLPVSGSKPRALLAILLLNANRVVPPERLIDFVWGEQPPESARGVLQTYVSQLRQLLEPERMTRARAGVLVSQQSGYMLRLRPEQLDLHRFQALTEAADRDIADGGPGNAARRLREAAALWRGPALAEFDSPAAEGERSRLEELRLGALEARIDAEMALGHHAGLVGELRGLVAEHPLRERLRGQLMLALYRSGRPAEAAAVYQEARERLTEEMGMEPSPVLQRLLRDILNQDPGLDLKQPPPGAAHDGAGRPAAAGEAPSPPASPPLLAPSPSPPAPPLARGAPATMTGARAQPPPVERPAGWSPWMLALVWASLVCDLCTSLYWLSSGPCAAGSCRASALAWSIVLVAPGVLGAAALGLALRPPAPARSRSGLLIVPGAVATACTGLGLVAAVPLLWGCWHRRGVPAGAAVPPGRLSQDGRSAVLALSTMLALVMAWTAWGVHSSGQTSAGLGGQVPPAQVLPGSMPADPCPGKPVLPEPAASACGTHLGRPLVDLDCGRVASVPDSFAEIGGGLSSVSLSDGDCVMVPTPSNNAILTTVDDVPDDAVVVADFTPAAKGQASIALRCTQRGCVRAQTGPSTQTFGTDFHSSTPTRTFTLANGERPLAGHPSRLVMSLQGRTATVWLNGVYQGEWTTSVLSHGMAWLFAQAQPAQPQQLTVRLHRFAVYALPGQP